MTGVEDPDEHPLADRILSQPSYAERVSALGALRPAEVPAAAKQLLSRCLAVMRVDAHEASDRARLALSAASASDAPLEMLACASALAQALVVLGRFGDAVSTADSALRRAAVARIGEEERREIEIVRIGALANLERFEEARVSATVILHRCEREADLRGRIWLRMILADIDSRQDLPRDALRRYREVDALLPATVRPTLRAALATNRGNALAAVHRFRAAERSFERARALFVAAGDDHEVARTDYDAAYVELSRGRYESALRRYARVEERFRALADERHLGHVDLDRAEIYVRLGLGADARRVALAARTRFDGLGLRKESALASLAAARGALLLGASDAVEADLAEAATAFDALGLPERRLLATVERASAALARNALVEVGRLADEAATCVRSTTGPAALGALHALRARLALARGLPEEAGAAVLEARTAMGRAVPPWAKLELLWIEARIAVAERREEDALDRYREAIDALERDRGGVPPDEYMTAFLTGRAELYREIVDLLVQRGEGSVAFHYAERSKARALVEILAKGPTPAIAAGGRDVSPRVAHLRERLNAIYRRLGASRADGGRGLRATERDLDEANRVETEMACALRDRRLHDPSERILSPIAAPSLAEVQRELGERTTLLQYMETGGGLVIFVVTRDQVRVVRPSLERGALSALVARFGRLASAQGADVVQGRAATQEVLAALSAALIGSVAHLLQGERLIVIPSGALFEVPFHALGLGPEAVVDRFEVVYAPSAAVYMMCGRRRTLASGPPTVLALPDADAPRIADEARRAAYLLGATLHTGADATLSRLAQACRDARIVHVATHGMFRRASPTLSSFALADGWVNLYDVYPLEVRGELVVLSTCESGTPEVSRGDEVLGLLRGFLCAGARALLTTQWRVDDAAAAAFMGAFYQAIAAGSDAAAAHRRAVLSVRETHPDPARWGAFFLSGHPVPKNEERACSTPPAPVTARHPSTLDTLAGATS